MGSTGVTFRAKKEPTMRKITILFAMLLVLAVARPAHALVSYTFTGGGFDGTLFLDDSVPFVITPPHLISIPGLTSPIFFDFTTGTLDSVLNFVSGSFGDFTFFGRPELNIFQDERPDPPQGGSMTGSLLHRSSGHRSAAWYPYRFRSSSASSRTCESTLA
jgi:hypothetical protein